MNIKRLFPNKMMLSRIFTCIFLILILPLTIFLVLFYNYYVDAKSSYYSALFNEQSAGVSKFTSEIIAGVEGDLLKLRYDSALYDYRYIKQPGATIQNTINLSERLSAFKTKYSMINSIYFYHASSDTVFSDLAGSHQVDTFYDKVCLGYIPDDRQFSGMFLRSAVTPMGESAEMITAVYKLNYNNVVFVNIDPNILANYITTMTNFSFKTMAIQDGKAQDILRMNYGAPLDDPLIRFIADYDYSHSIGYNDWSLRVTVPQYLLNQDILMFTFFVAVSYLFLLVVALGFSLLASKYIYRPIDNLIDETKMLLSDHDHTINDEVLFFKNVFTRFQSQESYFSQQAEMHAGIIKSYTCLDFLKGALSYGQFLEFCSTHELDLKNEVYKVILFYSPKHEAQDQETIIQNLQITAAMDTYIQTVCKGFFLEHENEYVCLISAEKAEILSQVALNLGRILARSFNLNYAEVQSVVFTNMALSSAYFSDIMRRVELSRFLLTDQLAERVADQEMDATIPINLQVGVIRDIILDKKENLNQHIVGFVEFLRGLKNLQQIHHLIFMLVLTISNEFPCKEILGVDLQEECTKINDIDALKAFLHDICYRIADYLKQSKAEENDYVNQAKQFIQENYTKNISATDISDYLTISYPYLSKLFKEGTNTNIIDYINIIRVEKSKELLTATPLTLPQIAEQIGYANQQSFQRFFKKLVNMTPGEFRKMKT